MKNILGALILTLLLSFKALGACDIAQTNYFADTSPYRTQLFDIKSAQDSQNKIPNIDVVLSVYKRLFRTIQNNFFSKVPTSAEEAWSAISNDLKSIGIDDGKKLQAANRLAREHKIIDDFIYRSLESVRNNKTTSAALTISEYLKRLVMVRNRTNVCPTFYQSDKSTENTTDKSTMPIKAQKWPKIMGIYPQERLYTNFEYVEIKQMAELMSQTIQFVNALDAKITYTTQENNQVSIPLSLSEQYRAALKVFQREFERLKLSPNFLGRDVRYIDIVTAALEFGTVSYSEVNEVLEFEEFWNPKKSKFQKIKTWLSRGLSVASPLAPPLLLIGFSLVEEVANARTNSVRTNDILF